MIKRCYIVICILTSLSCSNNKPELVEDARFNGMEERIDSLISEYYAVGLSVAVIEGNETVYAKGFGYRDAEKELAADAHTLFGIGSCTKAFTAAILGILQEEEKLRFTDSPLEYIPDLSFYSQHMNDSIQVEHLLTHSTGIGNMSSESTAILFETPHARELIPRIQHLKPQSGVGVELMYNNLMYTLAGMVGEGITGNSWEENTNTLLFEPIGMKETYSNYESAAKQLNFSFGYAVDSITPAKVLPEVITTRAPAGAIFSSAHDMAEWLKVWMNEGKANGKQLLSKAYTSEAIAERVLWPSNPNDTIASTDYYGYGWLNGMEHGYRRVGHSGGVSGYGSNVVFFPEEKIGIVVLTNQTASSLAGVVTMEVMGRLLPKVQNEPHEAQYSQAHTILPPDTPTTVNLESPPTHDLPAFEGVYTHPGFGEIVVSYEGETLYADFPMTKLRLTHNENNEFFDHYTEQEPVVMWNFMRLNFEADSQGTIDGVIINLATPPIKFEKIKKE